MADSLWTARRVSAIICIAGATVVPTYITGALTVALPALGTRIGLSGTSLQWPLSVFSLINGAFLLLCGGVADGTSRKAVFLAGNAWMAIFSIPLATAGQAETFIALCAVLGLGPAMLAPAATGILSESLPDGPIKNAAFATLGAGQPLGFILGLFFGGIFASKHAYIFAVAAACSTLFALGAFFVVPADGVMMTTADGAPGPRPRISLLRFDWLGAGLSALGLVALTLGLALAGTGAEGWRAPSVLSLVPVAAALLLAFFFWERQSQRQQQAIAANQPTPNPSTRAHTLRGPLIPPSIWSAPGFSPALACVWFGWFAFNTLTYYCTLVFQDIQLVSPIQTSIRFLPMVAAGILANVVGGVLISRVRPVFLVVGGSLTCAASCAIFATQDVEASFGEGMLPVVILIVGPDVFFPVIQLFACKSVGKHRAALAGSLFNVTTRLSTSMGLAICALVQDAATRRYAIAYSLDEHSHEAIMMGYRAAGWLCFGASIIAAIVGASYLLGTRISLETEESHSMDAHAGGASSSD